MEDAELDDKRDKLLRYLDHTDRVTHEETKKQEVSSKPVSRAVLNKSVAPKVLPILLSEQTTTTNDSSKPILATILAVQATEAVDPTKVLEQAKQERLNLESLSNKRVLIEQELNKAEQMSETIEERGKAEAINKQAARSVFDNTSRKNIEVEEVKHQREQSRLEAKRLKDNQRLQAKLARQKRIVEIKTRLAIDWQEFKYKFFKRKLINPDLEKKNIILGSKKIRLPAHFDFFKILRQWLFGGLCLILGFYFCYLFVVYTFAPTYIREVGFNAFLPAPAMISSEGIVDYYDYFEQYSKNATFELGEDFNTEILRSRIIRRWALHYNLDPSIDQKTLIQVLGRRVLEDVSINNGSSERYLSLRVAMRTSTDLAEISRKTKLKISTKLVTERLAKNEFGVDIFNLPDNRLSPIMFTRDGVAVLTKESLPENRLQLDYVYIPATTFAEILAGELERAWVVSLVR